LSPGEKSVTIKRFQWTLGDKPTKQTLKGRYEHIPCRCPAEAYDRQENPTTLAEPQWDSEAKRENQRGRSLPSYGTVHFRTISNTCSTSTLTSPVRQRWTCWRRAPRLGNHHPATYCLLGASDALPRSMHSQGREPLLDCSSLKLCLYFFSFIIFPSVIFSCLGRDPAPSRPWACCGLTSMETNRTKQQFVNPFSTALDRGV